MKSLLSMLLFFLMSTNFCAAQNGAMPSATAVMDGAMAAAKKENKNVFLIFHASWCGWCKQMEASLNHPSLKEMFNDNYVITYLDVMEGKGNEKLENPGGLEVLKKFKGEQSGLPFWVILDSDGKLLADSQMRPAGAGLDTTGENVGCPAQPEEVNHFVEVLKATSKLNDKQLAVISAYFSKKRSASAGK